MPTGYIPRGDGAFDAWQANFRAYIDAHYGELGLPSDVPVRVRAAMAAWDKAYGEHTAARQAAAAARRAKDDRRPDWGLRIGDCGLMRGASSMKVAVSAMQSSIRNRHARAVAEFTGADN